MMKLITDELNRVFRNIKDWSNNRAVRDVRDAGLLLAKHYQRKIRAGLDGNNGRLLPIKKETLDKQIHGFGSDSRIRKTVNPSRNPLVATGETVNSITSKSILKGAEISPDSPKAQIVLGINEAKYGRDPLVVGDYQLDVVVDFLLDGLERAIRK